ncbi:LANO_0A03092g1_1 [Lachancea nothofagi CBS 11611]|uniref:LANO_0A03092g1_1 n=1 Tax=Lachancea nothofagi CBS 11611 TaxID=1266666 RepID=A0A1G4IPJ9_9SACH|nr:LANO_0A03092g1_1 [Lachancea nothofagi CBS 11611]
MPKMISTDAIHAQKLSHGTFIYRPTDEELSKGTFVEKVSNFGENLYWMYYIHLPYYLMTSGDAFCLHSFFLGMFTLGLFGLVKYMFL